MTLPQWIYIIAVTIYVGFFFLFLRFFVWKRYAEKNYWRRRPELSQEKIESLASLHGREAPYLSVVIPARNESDVIEKTIDHMCGLNYAKNRYEVIVVTDEKETLARQEAEKVVIPKTLEVIEGQGLPERGQLNRRVNELLLGALTHFCFKECGSAVRPHKDLLALDEIPPLAGPKQRALIREISLEILRGKGKIPLSRLFLLLRRALPGLALEEMRRVYPIYLSLAMPVVAAFCRFRPDLDRRIVAKMIRYTAQANHRVTRKILASLTEVVSNRIIGQIYLLKKQHRLKSFLLNNYAECFPTTQEIVERRRSELAVQRQGPRLKHVCVPYDFDGAFPGRRTGQMVPSTKGRALNYALAFVDPDSEMCGFYDAESRPEPDVLLYVAHRRLQDGERVKILQGPVFQVRNFYEMSPFCKIASLYQAIAHDWYLPALFRRLPFVGGTNLYVDTHLLFQIKGYDQQSLTEDLELGARAYLEHGAWPEYLPYFSSEQTPPTIQAFFRQRLRWGTGHLQVMDKIRRESHYAPDRKRPLLRELFLKGHVEWVTYQTATFVPPTVLILWWSGYVDPNILPDAVRWGLNLMSAIYISFTIYAYHRYSRLLDRWAAPASLLGRGGVIAQLFFLPLAAFFFPVPYSSALVLKTLGKHPTTWTKTPRTKE
ncbi:MAG: glycosyltransferase [Firmicutes bacterium]|nr:glycosyltransferase [Bacillota bacterium]MCL5040459.1 glycosyltransferase [Bacillota bacterium]